MNTLHSDQGKIQQIKKIEHFLSYKIKPYLEKHNSDDYIEKIKSIIATLLNKREQLLTETWPITVKSRIEAFFWKIKGEHPDVLHALLDEMYDIDKYLGNERFDLDKNFNLLTKSRSFQDWPPWDKKRSEKKDTILMERKKLNKLLTNIACRQYHFVNLWLSSEIKIPNIQLKNMPPHGARQQSYKKTQPISHDTFLEQKKTYCIQLDKLLLEGIEEAHGFFHKIKGMIDLELYNKIITEINNEGKKIEENHFDLDEFLRKQSEKDKVEPINIHTPMSYVRNYILLFNVVVQENFNATSSTVTINFMAFHQALEYTIGHMVMQECQKDDDYIDTVFSHETWTWEEKASSITTIKQISFETKNVGDTIQIDILVGTKKKYELETFWQLKNEVEAHGGSITINSQEEDLSQWQQGETTITITLPTVQQQH